MPVMGLHDYLRFIFALAFVVSLMVLVGYVMRRLGWNKLGIMNATSKRLSVLEIRQIDPRHRLVIVKCDTTEHLLVLGPDSQTVIQSEPKQ